MIEFYNKEEQEFVVKCMDWKRQVEEHHKVINTRFLTLREQQIMTEILGKSSFFHFQFFGGYESAERKRCIIYPDYLQVNHEDFNVTCYKINYNKKFINLTHPHVLGSLMGLNLDRSHFGDIIFYDNNDAYFFATKQIETIIDSEFKSVGRAHVDTAKISETIDYQARFKTKDIIVSSMRLDTLISRVFNQSRNKSSTIIKAGHAQINFKTIDNPAYTCNKQDVISVRRYGRAVIDDVVGETKKEKIILTIKVPM